MLALRLPPQIEKRLATLARKTGRTKSYYAREAIMRHIEDIEDFYLARRRLARRKSRNQAKAAGGKRAPADTAWLRSLSATLNEWSSAADSKAYDDL